MARARIAEGEGDRAVVAALDGDVEHPVMATAVRYLLQILADRHPGGSVEVRVPPFGAVQCVAGLRHGRGTPPNVVETDARTWLALATGHLDWTSAVASGSLRASGSRTPEIARHLPLR